MLLLYYVLNFTSGAGLVFFFFFYYPANTTATIIITALICVTPIDRFPVSLPTLSCVSPLPDSAQEAVDSGDLVADDKSLVLWRTQGRKAAKKEADKAKFAFQMDVPESVFQCTERTRIIHEIKTNLLCPA